MTKGSGMIHPNMATTLGFVMTDATVAAGDLCEMLSAATERSYNSLSVDGDMSTNDMVLLMANGVSRVKPDKRERCALGEAITAVMQSLAKQIAADGEGARKLVEIRVSGFRTNDDSPSRASGGEFTVGQDRDRRQRSELGAHSERGWIRWREFRSRGHRHLLARYESLPQGIGGRLRRSCAEAQA
jgi:hypothetical protein